MSSLWLQADLVRSDDSYCRLSQPAAGYSLRGDARSAADRQAVREASEGGTKCRACAALSYMAFDMSSYD